MTIFTQVRVRQSVLEDYEAPLSDVLGAAARESLLFSPLSSLQRMGELREAEEGEITYPRGPRGGGVRVPQSPMMAAGDARKRIAEEGVDLQVPDAGIRQGTLDILIERKKDEKRRQDILARGPSGFLPGAARIGVGLGASLLDPINVASAFIPVVGEARYAALLARAGGAFGRAGARVGVGALEGAAGAALVEPLIYAAATQEQADYDLTDSLLNIGVGTVLGGGLHVGVGAATDAISRGLNWRQARASEPLPQMLERLDTRTRESALRAGLAQAMSGRPIDVQPIVTYAANSNAALDEAPMRVAVGQDFVIPVSTEAFSPGVAQASQLGEPTSARVSQYVTAKGSAYLVHEDGTTTRNKAFRPEHGPAEQGVQRRSDKTFYVTSEDAQKLGEFQTQGVAKAVAQVSGRQWAVKYLEGSNVGKFERRTVVTVFDKPAVGLTPVEIWKDGTRVHFGNEIVSVVAGDVQQTILPPKSTFDELRSATAANFASLRLADFESVRIADERLKTALPDNEAPERGLAEVTEDLERLVEALDGRKPRKAFKPGLPPNPENRMPARPVIGMLKEAGGVKPGSPLATELAQMGVTAKNTPGLFRKTGRGRADNFVRSEHPIFAGEGGAGDLNDYIDEAEILEAIRDELFGAPRRSPDQLAEIERYRQIVEVLSGVVREETEGLAEFLDAIPPPRGEDDYGTYEAMVVREMAEYEELQNTAEAYGRAIFAAASCQLRRGA